MISRAIALSVVSLLLLTASTSAADIYLIPESEELPNVIAVEGEILPDDRKRFQEIAVPLDEAIVAFNSPGGSLYDGVEIGRAIHIKRFSTAVFPDHVCASACALAWLAGQQRLATETSLIGFHAAFSESLTGELQTSGPGNALTGSYLNQLGLSDEAIFLVTVAAPNEMAWLTPEIAEQVGLDVDWVLEDGEAATAYAPQQRTPPTVTVTPGQPAVPATWNVLPDADLSGGDLPGMPIQVGTADECQRSCQSRAGCVAFTFNAQHNACFLKNDVSRSLPFMGAFSAYRADLVGPPAIVGRQTAGLAEFRVSENSEILALGTQQFYGVDLEWCHRACVLSGQCVAYSYYPMAVCEFKSAAKPTTPKADVVSGVRVD